MIELRWYQEKTLKENWDSRWDEWNTFTVCSTPKLQYLVGNDWIDIPLITKVTDERTHNRDS